MALFEATETKGASDFFIDLGASMTGRSPRAGGPRSDDSSNATVMVLVVPHQSTEAQTNIRQNVSHVLPRPFAIDYATNLRTALAYIPMRAMDIPDKRLLGDAARIFRDAFRKVTQTSPAKNSRWTYDNDARSDGFILAGSMASGPEFKIACERVSSVVQQLLGTEIVTTDWHKHFSPLLPTLGNKAADWQQRIVLNLADWKPDATGVAITNLFLPADYPATAPSAVPVETALRDAAHPQPEWLPNVERRITNSLEPSPVNVANDGQWISASVCVAAVAVIRQVADLFPTEPYLYASKKGDLVVESKGVHGPLTLIISPTFALFFAVVDEQPIERRVDLSVEWLVPLRKAMLELSELLSTGYHGAVDSKSG